MNAKLRRVNTPVLIENEDKADYSFDSKSWKVLDLLIQSIGLLTSGSPGACIKRPPLATRHPSLDDIDILVLVSHRTVQSSPSECFVLLESLYPVTCRQVSTECIGVSDGTNQSSPRADTCFSFDIPRDRFY